MTTPRRGPPFKDRVRNGILERKCRKCGDWAQISEFVPQRAVKHGRTYKCKLCRNAYFIEWRRQRKDRAA